jgi:hypothetical protein
MRNSCNLCEVGATAGPPSPSVMGVTGLIEQAAMVGRGAKDRLGRVFFLVSIGVSCLLTAAWVGLLIWFVFFYLL